MTSKLDDRIPVLVVGAGPVGLASAIELGSRGVRCLVVERNDRVGYAPRAKTTNVRTREHLRRWGIADRLRDASPFGVDYPSNVVFVTRLGGHGLARFENAFCCAPARSPFYSEHAQWIPQYALEEVLRTHAQTLPGVEIRFAAEAQSFEQDAHGVRTQVRDLATGAAGTIRSRYLVGADGARSTVRAGIGARMTGIHRLSRNYNVVFRAPGLDRAHPHGPAIMYWQVNPEAPGLIGPMDRGDKWFFMPTQVPESVKLGELDAAALIRKGTGIDLRYEILSADEWVASRLIADRYRDRRVFLAGDACHLHPPFGGYGMNMGIADGVDLGWKLAAVLQGWGGSRLLDSYELERRPVHEYVMDEAVANHAVLGNQLWREGLDAPGEAGERLRRETGERIRAAKVREFETLGAVLGYRYDDSPVIFGEGGEPPPRDSRRYVPSARPGCLAPHAWLEDGSSLYDRFGAGFALLVAGEPEPAALERWRAAASAARVPLAIVQLEERGLRELYRARYALIRPDQHVAWRGNALPDLAATFARVAGRTPV
jgi:2-polyprenyl-6-methoxyphenol hydroxylase-like FAD-dependent oxidoreductase